MDNNLSRFIEMAKELGAYDAKIIDPGTIETAAWVRMKCQFGCRYKKTYCCPPNTPTPKETREVIDCYKTAMIIHGMNMNPSDIVLKLEREILLAGYYKVIGYGCGSCRLCKTCNEEKCAHPKDMRPSMEACGIDVFETVRRNGFPISVLRDRNESGNYYGLLLIE